MSGPIAEINFRDADGPIRFATTEMASEFRRVVHSWPLEHPAPAADPFAEAQSDGSRWSVHYLRPEQSLKKYNSVNAICDLIVELNWSRLRRNPELMCLHASGVRMGAGLVVFPSERRAGKSTLTAELARRGHPVFTDDILAARLDETGVACGLATGIAPRLRLPLPQDASHAFCDWVNADPGPANKQYKYLTDAPVSDFGTSCPIGAIITLDRQDGGAAVSLTEIDAQDVLPVLIHQNFGRFSHAGRTLAAFEAIANSLPCLRLSYGRFEDAADRLEQALESGLLAGRAVAQQAIEKEPNFDRVIRPYESSGVYRQRAGYQCVKAGDEAIISDVDGLGIFRMGLGMMPIWSLLEAPISEAEIVSVLAEVFPDVDAATIRKDVTSGMTTLNEAGLIELVTDP